MLQQSQIRKKLLEHLDINYSYQLAKRMEQHRTNPVLGYRTAGSQAEFLTGEMLFEEMKRIGLSDVTKDPFTLDGWEFSHAKLSFLEHTFELGSYQTQFDSNGPKQYTILYAGRGTDKELSQLDVRGKLVLIDINQRDDWWISYPAYQAHLHGAAAIITVQLAGYGEVDATALNAQNICSIPEAPAFSISQADGTILRNYLRAQGGEATVVFDAKSTVTKNVTSYNIVGKIPGRDPDAMLMLSAHYDSYFDGFQDDNTAIAITFGIAKALIETGYQPEKTILVCALAAEEWGICNSKYDWSTGAYNQIFRVHPEWAGKIWADLNFELPACAHGHQDIIRSVYELDSYLREFITTIPEISCTYPDGLSVASPVQTWSDDFSFAIGGVPSMVNHFSDSHFMHSHYHTQFDNDASYQEDIYRFHHQLYGALLLALDRCVVPPLDFSTRLSALRVSLAPANLPNLDALDHAQQKASALWQQVRAHNNTYLQLLEEGQQEKADAMRDTLRPLAKNLLACFRSCEDHLTRLSWHDDVVFPHEYAQENLSHLSNAKQALAQHNTEEAIAHLIEIDVNRYALAFDIHTCRHFVDYVLHQPDERLMWGAGRIMGVCELFDPIKSLQETPESAIPSACKAVDAQISAQESLLKAAYKLEHQTCLHLCEKFEEMQAQGLQK